MDLREDLKFYGKLAQRRLGYAAGQLELTSDCFQRCVACDSWRAHVKGEVNGVLPYMVVSDLLQQLNRMPTFEHLSFTGGDPQSWPGFDDFLAGQRPTWKFTVQANTALAKDPDWFTWRMQLNRVRVSLDGVTPETYRRMRGVRTDPEEIIARMEKLEHKMLATNTCVTDLNIDEVPLIIERLNRMKNPPRKAMFLAVLDFEKGSDFWKKYAKLKEIPSANVPTSFAEDVEWVRGFTASKEADAVPCYAGAISFHIKCDGNVYPCCLVGGEAIKTRPDMAIGNILREPLTRIQERYVPAFHYRDKEGPCVAVCQYKQLQVNLIAHRASKTTLAMP